MSPTFRLMRICACNCGAAPGNAESMPTVASSRLCQSRLSRSEEIAEQVGLEVFVNGGREVEESPSQFSREFKRLFGVTPVEDAELTRDRPVSGCSH